MECTPYISLYEKALPDTLSLREKSELLLKAGYNGLEISIDESDYRLSRVLDKSAKAEILAEIKQIVVPIRTMCLSGQRRYPLGSRNADVRQMSHKLLKAAIDFSCDVGIRIIQIPGYDVWYEERGEDTARFFMEGLEQVVPYAAQNGVILAFETMENDFMNTTRKALRVVETINSPYLQIYPDTGNVTNGTEDPIADFQAARGHIVAAHLKDTKPGIFRDLAFGAGQVDFVGCIQTLLSQGVYLFNCEIWHDKKTEPFSYIQRNYDYIKECFQKAGAVL